MVDEKSFCADPEIVENEIDGGTGGAIINTHEVSDTQLVAFETIAKNANRMMEAKQKIWSVLLKIAKPGDWTVFESNKRKKAELGHGGAMRYAAFLGISFTNWTSEKVNATDEKGNWYRWDFECDCIFSNRTIRVYGRAGSRDKFFGKDHGEYKELYQINEGDIKMAARRNAMKEGVKTILGLHHIPAEELEAAGVNLEYATTYSFQSRQGKADNTKSITVYLELARLKKEGETNGKKWKLYVIRDKEGVEYSTFSETIVKSAQSAIGHEKQVTMTLDANGKNVTDLTVAQ